MNDDNFWRYHEMFHGDSGDNSGGGYRSRHPVYWGVVAVLFLIMSVVLHDSPGIPIAFLAIAASFSCCL